jgi:hypothetical protein
MAMLRSVLGVIVGVLVMWWVVAGIASASHAIFPPSVGLDPMPSADLEKILAVSLPSPGLQ